MLIPDKSIQPISVNVENITQAGLRLANLCLRSNNQEEANPTQVTRSDQLFSFSLAILQPETEKSANSYAQQLKYINSNFQFIDEFINDLKQSRPAPSMKVMDFLADLA